MNRGNIYSEVQLSFFSGTSQRIKADQFTVYVQLFDQGRRAIYNLKV